MNPNRSVGLFWLSLLVVACSGESAEGDLDGCTAAQFRCGDGVCLLPAHLCDGTPQCAGAEDEANCAPTDLCTDNCTDAADGWCDDGAAGADHATCTYGTDCTDCGPRPPITTDCAATNFACGDGACLPAAWVCDGVSDCAGGEDEASCSTTDRCTNTCTDAADGWCDDGAAGADYGICTYGTDCADCGPRPQITTTCAVTDFACSSGACLPASWVCDGFSDCATGEDEAGCTTTVLCTDTCAFPADGDCDDGGVGADYSICTYGTDCADCGPRT